MIRNFDKKSTWDAKYVPNFTKGRMALPLQNWLTTINGT